jgi:IS5 family transposase
VATTFGARETARTINAALTKAGVKASVTDKQVRQWVRDNIDAYDDDGYTSHAYSVAQRDRIVKAIVAKRTASGAKGRGSDARATSASKGRSGTVKHSARESAARTADAAPKRSTVKRAGIARSLGLDAVATAIESESLDA